MKSFFSLLLLATLLSLPLEAKTDEISPLLETVKQLVSHPVDSDDSRVPEDLRSLLVKYKRQLRGWIETELQKPDNAKLSPSQLQGRLQEKLKKEGLLLDDTTEYVHNPYFGGFYTDEETFAYGALNGLFVQSVPDQDHLLVVGFSLKVVCGIDACFYLFEKERGTWKLALVREAAPYDSISDALDNFSFFVSPPDKTGDYFVVTAHMPAWCTSNLSRLEYWIMRPGPDPDHPRILAKGESSCRRNDSPPFELTGDKDGFLLRYYSEQSFDYSILIRPYIRKYIVQGEKVTRVPPLALSPEDFLQEWSKLPWNEASRWCASDKVKILKEWHDRKLPKALEAGGEFLFVQPCPDKSSWQIGWGPIQEGKAGKFYATVTRSGGSFLIQDIRETRLPGCPGELSPWTHSHDPEEEKRSREEMTNTQAKKGDVGITGTELASDSMGKAPENMITLKNPIVPKSEGKICFHINQAAKASKWKLYDPGGVSRGEFAFQAETDPCIPTTGLSTGLYFLVGNLTLPDGTQSERIIRKAMVQ